MNNKSIRLRTEFGPETRFELSTSPPAPFRAVQENELERLKKRLLRRRLAEIWDAELNSLVRRAANEAASLAWVTAYPLLVFPVLFEEKARAAVAQAERQQDIRERSRELLTV